MKNTYSVKVPTKTYLRKFISSWHPMELTYNNTLSILILSLLDKKSYNINMNESIMAGRIANLPDQLEFTCSTKSLFYKGIVLSKDKIIAINRFMEHKFVEELHTFCEREKKHRDWRPGIDQAIRKFAVKYEIDVDEDISFDALKKAEYRYRKNLEQKGKINVPSKNGGFSSGYFSFAQIA